MIALAVHILMWLSGASGVVSYLRQAHKRDWFVIRWLDHVPATLPGIHSYRWPRPRLRMPRIRARGQHAASLGLVFDYDSGRYRNAETGPLPRLGEREVA